MASLKKKKDQANPNLKECANCLVQESSSTKLKHCVKCHMTFYCGRDCQEFHWKAGHKQFCISKAEQLLSAQREENITHDHTTNNQNNETCVICQDALDSESRMLSCFHTLHEHCLNQFIQFSDTKTLCPVCRCATVPSKETVSSLPQPV